MLTCDWVPDGFLEAHSPGTGLVGVHQSPSAVAALEIAITVITIDDKFPSEVATCPELSYHVIPQLRDATAMANSRQDFLPFIVTLTAILTIVAIIPCLKGKKSSRIFTGQLMEADAERFYQEYVHVLYRQEK